MNTSLSLMRCQRTHHNKGGQPIQTDFIRTKRLPNTVKEIQRTNSSWEKRTGHYPTSKTSMFVHRNSILDSRVQIPAKFNMYGICTIFRGIRNGYNCYSQNHPI